MAIREGAWDCPVCGRKGNRGPDKFCGGCGAPRGPEVKFYLPEEAPEVTDAEALKRAQAGPDWACPYCEADNPSTNAFCSGCGAPREGTQTRQVVEHRLDAKPPAPTPPPKKPLSPRVKKGCGLGCLGLLLLLALLAFLGRPREKDLTVIGFHWSRTIAVEELRPVVEQAWEGEVPSAASVLDSRREVHHVNRIQIGTERKTRTVSERVQTGTERVKVGTRDLGNGYFEDVYEDRPVYETQTREESYNQPILREEPVYRQRIRFQVEKWHAGRVARAGAKDRSPAWPDPRLSPKERESRREESYEILFRDEDGDLAHYQAPNEQLWRSFEEGRIYRGKVQGDKVVEIESGGE